MPHYFVVSPEMSEVVPVLDYGQGPLEYFSCVATVDAANKRDAIKAAIKHPKMKPWVQERRSDGLSPFAGLKAEETRCPHGKCYCEMCNEHCAECAAECESE